MIISLNSYSQAKAYKQGDNLINIGVGVNSSLGGIPIGAISEYGITKEISVGGSIDYWSSSVNYSSLKEKFKVLYLGLRGSYHANEVLKIKSEKADIYGGASLGYKSFKWSDNLGGSNSGSISNGIYLGIYIGGKYYFTEGISVFAELGAGGASYGRIGIGFNF